MVESSVPSMIYLDNAATSWPKPPCVAKAISEAITAYGGNPGRGGHKLALAAGNILYDTRDLISDFFGSSDPFRIIFTQNITMSLNMVIRGFLSSDDHVLISPMEHNAVMRPLTAMKIRYDILPHESNGSVIPEKIPSMIRPETKMIIICHESNVNGVVQPIRQIGKIARENNIFLMADCAQSAGHIPVRCDTDFIDFLCFTGHKGLMGPTGTGGLVLGDCVNIRDLRTMIYGGTGSLSESYLQPEFMPDKFESGTQNVCGLAGLNAGIKWLEEQGIERLHAKSRILMKKLTEGLSDVPGIKCYSESGEVLSVTIDRKDNGTAAEFLEHKYGIMTRIGLHCAPLAHHTLGTFPNGTIRFAVSPFTTEDEIDTCIRACCSLAEAL